MKDNLRAASHDQEKVEVKDVDTQTNDDEPNEEVQEDDTIKTIDGFVNCVATVYLDEFQQPDENGMKDATAVIDRTVRTYFEKYAETWNLDITIKDIEVKKTLHEADPNRIGTTKLSLGLRVFYRQRVKFSEWNNLDFSDNLHYSFHRDGIASNTRHTLPLLVEGEKLKIYKDRRECDLTLDMLKVHNKK